MIAIDSFALVAIVMEEPGHGALSETIAENDCIIGASTRFEAIMVIRARTFDLHLRSLLSILNLRNFATVELTPAHAQVSQAAFEKFGKALGHPAQLNFRNCKACAIASIASVPLLYKGGDFAQTDIATAHAP